jgi:tRNA uridine 5-carboxymethylaminomethyl modification enzyme
VEERERVSRLLKRPNVKLTDLIKLDSLAGTPVMQQILGQEDHRLKDEILEQIEIELKYEGYIQRQVEQIGKFDKLESRSIPVDFDYKRIRSLSTEGREKLSKVKPESIGQASRISGVTPSDISVLLVSLHK